MNYENQIIDLLKNIKNNQYENIEKFNDSIIKKDNKDSYKNLDIQLNKKNYVFFNNKYELKKNQKFIIDKNNNGDICFGFLTSEDCILKILFENNIYENIVCKKNIISYLEIPLFLISSFYNEISIITDKNVYINIISIFIEHSIRIFLARNNFSINNKLYFNGLIYHLKNGYDTKNNYLNFTF